MNTHDNQHDSGGHGHKHFVLPPKKCILIGAILLVFTVITVAVAQVDLGSMNFPVAMLVATIKGLLVALFFMGLKYDSGENIVTMVASLMFCTIFFVLTSTDLFFRPGLMPSPIDTSIAGPPMFKKPWISQPPILAKGKELFDQQCVSCHGPKGEGNGPAASALNPKPRNFTSGDNWKNGRKPSQIFGTLTKGLNQMPSFGSLPAEQRWALAHFVRTLGPEGPADTAADLKLAGINDPTKDDGGMGSSGASIPIDLAIQLLGEEAHAGAR